MADISKQPLGKIMTLHRGYDLPSTSRSEGCYPVISSSGISDYHADYKTEGPNVVTGRYGTIGKVTYYDGPCWPLNTTLYVSDFHGNHPRYVAYLLETVLAAMSIDGSDKSTVPGVDRNVLHSMTVPFIERDFQTKYIAVLSALDDKIVNNKKLMAELESTARLIYDYWFTQFDFPDENGNPYRSSGGKMVYNDTLRREIPADWEIGEIGDLCTCCLGGTPSRNKPEYWGGNINWINSGSVNEFRISSCSETITEEGLANTSTYVMPKNTTVLAITGATLGQISILNIEACANQSVIGVLETEQIPTEYIYHFISRSIKLLLNQQTGAAQPHISKQDVASLRILVPPKEVMNSYLKHTKSMSEIIMQLCDENLKLESLRDWLLPMLMNGQASVGDMQ